MYCNIYKIYTYNIYNHIKLKATPHNSKSHRSTVVLKCVSSNLKQNISRRNKKQQTTTTTTTTKNQIRIAKTGTVLWNPYHNFKRNPDIPHSIYRFENVIQNLCDLENQKHPRLNRVPTELLRHMVSSSFQVKRFSADEYLFMVNILMSHLRFTLYLITHNQFGFFWKYRATIHMGKLFIVE